MALYYNCLICDDLVRRLKGVIRHESGVVVSHSYK